MNHFLVFWYFIKWIQFHHRFPTNRQTVISLCFCFPKIMHYQWLKVTRLHNILLFLCFCSLWQSQSHRLWIRCLSLFFSDVYLHLNYNEHNYFHFFYFLQNLRNRWLRWKWNSFLLFLLWKWIKHRKQFIRKMWKHYNNFDHLFLWVFSHRNWNHLNTFDFCIFTLNLFVFIFLFIISFVLAFVLLLQQCYSDTSSCFPNSLTFVTYFEFFNTNYFPKVTIFIFFLCFLWLFHFFLWF